MNGWQIGLLFILFWVLMYMLSRVEDVLRDVRAELRKLNQWEGVKRERSELMRGTVEQISYALDVIKDQTKRP